MPTIKTETYRAPSNWASYLVNGDPSGLGDHEQGACDDWTATLAHLYSNPVECVEVGFYLTHDAYEFFPYATDCSLYTFQVIEK